MRSNFSDAKACAIKVSESTIMRQIKRSALLSIEKECSDE